eukprot:scaffold49949_cov24-Tisochrysis_lutea.AAC.3
MSPGKECWCIGSSEGFRLARVLDDDKHPTFTAKASGLGREVCGRHLMTRRESTGGALLCRPLYLRVEAASGCFCRRVPPVS